jgi:hypothetical protein
VLGGNSGRIAGFDDSTVVTTKSKEGLLVTSKVLGPISGPIVLGESNLNFAVGIFANEQGDGGTVADLEVFGNTIV